jgi:flagellar motility protein MotE (MotC chaperone)
MNGDLLKTLMELGSTGFIQLLLGVIIWKLIPKVQQVHEESIQQQRNDFKESLDKIEANRMKLSDDIADTVESLEKDIERLDDSIKAFANVYVSTQTQDAKKSQVLTDRIIQPEDEEDDDNDDSDSKSSRRSR